MKKFIACLLLFAAGLAAQSITPGVSCVSYDPSNQQLFVRWNYVSTFSQTQFIDAGSNNFVSPPPPNRGQVVFFDPGFNAAVWTTTIQLTATVQSISWTVEGTTATASNDPNLYCAGTAAPNLACWDTNGNGACDPAEDINGDGVCNALDCQGRPGPQGAPGPVGSQGPAGPQGPAGASLQAGIQLVTNATAAVSATASCPASMVVLNGGGICAAPNTNSISGRLASSQPSGASAWTVSCSTGQATAVALCAKSQ